MKVGFVELLTLILIVLKLLGKISIGWLLIFAPLLIVWSVVGLLALAVIALSVFVGGKKNVSFK